VLADILERNDCGEDRVLIDGEDLARLRQLAGFCGCPNGKILRNSE
jgi:hypothetical protein